MDFDDPLLKRGYSGTRAYGQSKLAQITARLEPPGEARPRRDHRHEPAPEAPTCRRRWCWRSAGSAVDTLEAGVEATVRVAVDPALEGVTGRFYDRQAGDDCPTRRRATPRARRRLWELKPRARSASPPGLSSRLPAPGTAPRKRSNQRHVAEQLDVVKRSAVPERGGERAGVGHDRRGPGPAGLPRRATNFPAPYLER